MTLNPQHPYCGGMSNACRLHGHDTCGMDHYCRCECHRPRLTAVTGTRVNGLPQRIAEPFTGDVVAWIVAGDPVTGGAREAEPHETPDGVELFGWDTSGPFAERVNVYAFLRDCVAVSESEAQR